LKGENLSATTSSGDISVYHSYGIEAFSVSQCYNNVAVYFDDVKVFSVFEVAPKLELVPAEGIAATTIVGSGFAPDSKISVTWDNIPIPAVPNPLFSDGYGNFTGIISVLNQTISGIHTVKAFDEIGNEAIAIFTVYSTASSSYSSPSIEEELKLENQYEELPEFAGHTGDALVNRNYTLDAPCGTNRSVPVTDLGITSEEGWGATYDKSTSIQTHPNERYVPMGYSSNPEILGFPSVLIIAFILVSCLTIVLFTKRLRSRLH
jgi:hypothetical protein